MRGVSPESFMRDVCFLSDENEGAESPLEKRTVIAAGTRVVCWYKRGLVGSGGCQGVVVMDVEPIFLLYSRVKSVYVVEKRGEARF